MGKEALAADVVGSLRRQGFTLAAAESLTAGLFCATVADVPGASNVLRGGVVVYATELKERLAGVSADTLQRVGPVAAETAVELAQGAKERCSATLGVGLTGVAGPAPQDGHPVGTVFIGIAKDGLSPRVVECRFQGTRQEIREQTVERALHLVLETVGESTSQLP